MEKPTVKELRDEVGFELNEEYEIEVSDEEERDELIYKIVVDRYDLEWKRTNDLDSKASSVIGFSGLLATLTAGITELLPESYFKFLLYIPLVVFVISAIFGLRSYWIMEWEATDPEALIQRYSNRTKVEVLRTFVATTSEMTMLNFVNNQRKVKWIYRAFVLLILAIVLFLAFSIVIVMS